MTVNDVRLFWNRRPCNIKHSRVDIETDPATYSRQVSARKYYVEPHIPRFAQHMRWNGKDVLELGCGIGTDALMFRRFGANVTAVDVSEESLCVAQKRERAENLGNIRWVEWNIESPRWHNEFDLVYSFGVIHHTPNPILALATARAALRPGGTLKIMLYHRRSWKVFRILLANLGKFFRWKNIDKVIALQSEAQGGSPITYTYTKDSARRLVESSGFKVTNVSVEHIFPYRVKDYIHYRYKRAFPWNIMPTRMFRWLERHIGWHVCVTGYK